MVAALEPETLMDGKKRKRCGCETVPKSHLEAWCIRHPIHLNIITCVFIIASQKLTLILFELQKISISKHKVLIFEISEKVVSFADKERILDFTYIRDIFVFLV
jgi:hypothetical protein